MEKVRMYFVETFSWRRDDEHNCKRFIGFQKFGSEGTSAKAVGRVLSVNRLSYM